MTRSAKLEQLWAAPQLYHIVSAGEDCFPQYPAVSFKAASTIAGLTPQGPVVEAADAPHRAERAALHGAQHRERQTLRSLSVNTVWHLVQQPQSTSGGYSKTEGPRKTSRVGGRNNNRSLLKLLTLDRASILVG